MTFIIAVDGPAAAGKGSLCRSLADHLDLSYLDTGLLYRRVAYRALGEGVGLHDEAACTRIAQALREAPTDLLVLRGEKMGQAASIVSAHPGVRVALTDYQREFAAHPPSGRGAVLDGRDIGTVICPEAQLKIFLTAHPEIRARRRYEDERRTKPDVTYEAILESTIARYAREAGRAVAPMRPAEDAVILNTSDLTQEEVLHKVLWIFKQQRSAESPPHKPQGMGL